LASRAVAAAKTAESSAQPIQVMGTMVRAGGCAGDEIRLN